MTDVIPATAILVRIEIYASTWAGRCLLCFAFRRLWAKFTADSPKARDSQILWSVANKYVSDHKTAAHTHEQSAKIAHIIQCLLLHAVSAIDLFIRSTPHDDDERVPTDE